MKRYNFKFTLTNIYAYIAVLILVLHCGAQAQNRRHLTTDNGLSNMSILSLLQDRDGYIWAATCDGVNRIENSRIHNFAAGNNGKNEFSGNLIETIRQDPDGNFWVHTNYGLDRFNASSGKIEYYREFNGLYLDAMNADGDMVVVNNADSLYYYNKIEGQFTNLGKMPFPIREIKALYFDSSHNIWVAHNIGLYSGCIKGGKMPEFREMFSLPIRSANVSEDCLYIISWDRKLLSYDFASGKSDSIYTLPKDLFDRGKATVIADGWDYVIAFISNGAVRLKRNITGFDIIPYDISSGVFSVIKDRNQDILWFGTDGDGIYYYSSGSYMFYSQTSAGKNLKFSKPVRSILSDTEGTVWTGTKGDGLFGFRNFEPGSRNDDVVQFTTENSMLKSNDIYALAPSSRDLFWIGTQERGLSYYSYIDHRIHHLDVPMMQRLQSVHAILETSPDELWVATLGEGVFRLTITGEIPEVKHVEEVIFDSANTDANAFFSIEQQNDSILWFGNRGMGAYRYNRYNRHLTVIDFSGKGKAVANDVFCIYTPHQDRDTAYCATSAGLQKVFRGNDGSFEFTEIPMYDRYPVHSVHALLDGGNSNMIASTNFGLIDYRLPAMSNIVYSSGTDFDIRQFSDGAAYRDTISGVLYFGAANGFVSLVPGKFSADVAYTPPVIFRSLLIGNETAAISNYLDSAGYLVLPYDENNFTISFDALDYRHGGQYVYRYRLKGASEQWISNFTGQVSFTNMSPGRYTLEVCYNNGFNWSKPYMLELRITPPFYASTIAYIIYGVLLIALIIFLIFMTLRIQNRKQAIIVGAMEQKRKEDVYEAKLKFFTNITHELINPLTLINGSCEKIMGGSDLNPETRKLTSTIRRNSTRLTELIQELIEFRRIDTEYRKPDVEILNVSSVVEEIFENFLVLAEKKHVIINADVAPNTSWPTDRSGFVTIVTNLMSNAMKYTPDGGEIRIDLRVENNRLILKIANTGEGIMPENISQIFDRYKVLERFERLSAAGTIKRNGLGLAVCDGLVKLLGGTIGVESRQGEWTTFTVELPEIAVTRTEPSKDVIHYQKQIVPVLPEERSNESAAVDSVDEKSDKPIIYVVDDNADILAFVEESLSGLYRVRRFTSAEDAAEALQKEWPALIVCDVVMDGMSGIDFARQVKSDKATLHIPFVQLSSLNSDEEKIKSLEAGADSYITKPFKVEFLLAVIDRLLQGKQKLKEYFDSSISSYEKVDGQILHSDDQNFLQRVLKTIEDNIVNPNLSTKMVAELLGLSVRNLYRRLDGITEQTPTAIIKEMRLTTAKNMLIHTSLSIDEIIYKSGFNNRGTFFKLFQQKFNCTPKQFRESQISSAKTDLGIS